MYQIFKLEGEDHLVAEGYGTKTITKLYLECNKYNDQYDTVEEAKEFIETEGEKYVPYIILPVYSRERMIDDD